MHVSGSLSIPDWLFVCLLIAWVVVVAIRAGWGRR